MSGKYRLLLAFWVGLFITSALILAANLRPYGLENGTVLPPFPIWLPEGSETEIIRPPVDKPDDGDGAVDAGTRWSLALSGISAFISAAGFMATTYFALRSDRRQTAQTELEVQSLALEIERQRLEIDRLRRAQQAQPALSRKRENQAL